MTTPVLKQIDDAKRLQLLVQAVTDYAIYLLDLEGNIVSWNSGAERIKGYTADQVIGRNFSMFFTDEDRAEGKPQRALRTAQSEGRFEGEGWRVRKDNTRFWASAVLDAVRDDNGEIIGFAKITRDLTERRAAQLQLDETRDQLFQAQKMEAIGQLTGGIAHDFNNLLTVIVSGADLADSYIKDNDRLKRLINNMREAALRGEKLTKQLLAFSRRQPLKAEPVDIARQLNSMTNLLSRSLRGDVQIASDVPADLWRVQADPSQLELALLNIGLNARDAMPEGGILTIRARNFGGGAKGPGHDPYVVVDIEDTGIGMSAEIQARAFEPFFTTKDIGRGSGLGLSQAYGFAKQSGGTLSLISAPGKGTKVSLHLPAATSEAAQRPACDAVARPRGASGGRVLLVEDDAGVAELALGLLQDAGYKVETASNAAAALEVLREGSQIDLVFSDVMMPGGMNGAEMAKVIRNEFPSIFILLTTGYAEAAAHAMTQEFPLIRKPYGREVLLDKLGEILGEAV
jgi:PAS domain S-box-containing protein